MSRRVMIGLWVLSAVAFLATDASAGCATISGKRVCASWITGGSEIGIVTAEGYGENDTACPGVFEAQGPSEDEEGGGGDVEIALVVPEPVSSLNLKLVGTVPTISGTSCGLGLTDNQVCDIKGVVFCGTAGSDPKHGADHPGKHLGHLDQGRAATTDGPLTVFATGFAQADGSGRQFAGFRFQLSLDEQLDLCPVGDFRTFVAQDGFFEACVNGTDCVREFCTVNVKGIDPDEPRVYSCRPVAADPV